MGETRVNLVHLLEDLRDAYPGSVEETIVTEMVANALDSGARRIAISTDAVAGTITVTDDGKGMSRPAMTRYHDLASTGKRRGRTIGFAGVGIKLGLLISDDVVTESRNKRTHLATSWRLTSKNRAPWRWIEPQGILDGTDGSGAATGTGVRLYLTNALSPLIDRGFIEGVVLEHFRPLLDPHFDEILAPIYPEGVRFVVNGREISRMEPEPGRRPIRIRVGRRRKPSGVGYVLHGPDVEGKEHGIEISTLGKIIKRGWEWLGLAPGEGGSARGLIEVPALAEALTLNKADFIRTGQKGATFLAYRKAIQEPIAELLSEWGDAPRPAGSRRPRTRSLERDLRSVLSDLSEEFPLIATLVERRLGGQRRLALGDPHLPGKEAVAGLSADTPAATPSVGATPPCTDEPSGDEATAAEGSDERPDVPGPATASVPGGKKIKRPGSYGLAIRFERRPNDPALGRLVESTVWVNEAHPAHRRSLASRSEGYHIALTVALTLAPLAVEAAQVEGFVTAFLALWGEAGTRES
jgi:Histidine kinase-, DNA gyrase B-, and HSP90-like ATPase